MPTIKPCFVRLTAIAALVALAVIMTGCGKKKPVNATELLESALAQALNGNRAEAIKQAERVVAYDPRNVSALLMMGLCQENSGQGTAALQNFKKAVEIDPGNVYALYHLGRILFQHGRYEDSLAPLRQAEKISPDNEDIQVLLAQIEEKLKLPTAINYYRKLASGTKYRNRPGIWNQLGIFYAEKHDNLNAIKSFMQAYKLAQDDHMVCLNMAVFLDRYLNTASSRSKAIQFYKKYLALSRMNPEFKAQRDKVSARIRELAKL